MVREVDSMSENRERSRLSNLFNTMQDDIRQLKSSVRRLSTSKSTISVSPTLSINHSAITGVSANQHHSQDHVSRHSPVGDDPLLLDDDTLAAESDVLAATQGNVKAYADGLDHDHATPIATHAGASDPHGDRAYSNGLDHDHATPIAAHAGAADPHGDRAYSDGLDHHTKYTNAEAVDAVEAVANAPIATGDSVIFKDVSDSGNLKMDLVSDLLALGGGGLTTEEVQDIVGAMFSGNTETRISATYVDGDNNIDLVVDDMNPDSGSYEASGAIATHTAITDAHHAKYTNAEAIAAADLLSLNTITSYVFKTNLIDKFCHTSDYEVSGPSGCYINTTGAYWIYFVVYVPDWLKRYADQNSKTVTVTTITVNWENHANGSYITRTIIYHMNMGDGLSAKADSIYDNSTDVGNGSAFDRDTIFNVTDTALLSEDYLMLRFNIYQDTASACRFFACEVTFTLA